MGRLMNWVDIQEKYPDKWVFAQDVKKDKDGNINSVFVLVVCNNAEKARWTSKFRADNIRCQCIKVSETM